MNAELREFRRAALLSLQRAMGGMVTSGLRCVTVGVDVGVIHARFIYDHEPTEFERELVAVAETEVYADWADDTQVTFRAVKDVAPRVEREEGESWLAYSRYEESPTHVERGFVEQVAIAGLGTWVAASELRTFVEQSPGRPLPGDQKTSVIGALTHLVLGGYATVGEVSDGGFVPWGDASTSLERAVAAVLAAETRTAGDDGEDADEASVGEIFWLQNTPSGGALARAVLQREADEIEAIRRFGAEHYGWKIDDRAG